MINFKKFFFYVIKPPNPAEHEFDGSSKEFLITDKLKNILKEIILDKNNISLKLFKIFEELSVELLSQKINSQF